MQPITRFSSVDILDAVAQRKKHLQAEASYFGTVGFGTLAQLFFCEFCKFLRTTYFNRTSLQSLLLFPIKRISSLVITKLSIVF